METPIPSAAAARSLSPLVDDATLQLLDAARDTLNHVQDPTEPRTNNQCTLCRTYRTMLHDAVEAFYKAHPDIIRVEDLPF